MMISMIIHNNVVKSNFLYTKKDMEKIEFADVSILIPIFFFSYFIWNSNCTNNFNYCLCFSSMLY